MDAGNSKTRHNIDRSGVDEPSWKADNLKKNTREV